MDVVGYGGLKSKRVHNVSLSTLRLAFGIPLAGTTWFWSDIQLVVNATAIRKSAISYNWPIQLPEAKNTIFLGHPSEKVYVSQPLGFIDPS